MEAALTTTPPRRASLRESFLAVTWWVLIGAAAGAISGFLVGGIGGRLAMLLLRLTSPDSVIGVISDDGFEIGVFTTSTLNLVLVTTVLGGLNGVLYAAVRSAIPVRLRLPLWVAFSALVGGATIVQDDGVDFTLLEPALLAIVLFVVLPGLAAALVVLLVEHWSATTPWQSRRLAAGLVVAAAASVFALVFAVIVAAVALVLTRSELLGRFVRRAGKIVVPVGLGALSVVAGVDLLQTSGRILE